MQRAITPRVVIARILMYLVLCVLAVSYLYGLDGGGSLLEGIDQRFAIPVKYPVSICNHNTVGEFQEFADVILNDKPVATGAVEGAYTVSVCLAIVESTQTGAPVKPDYNF